MTSKRPRSSVSDDDRPEIVPLVLGTLGVLIALSSCGQMLLGFYEAGAIVLVGGAYAWRQLWVPRLKR